MLPSFLGVYMYRSGCCITRWNGWIVTDFGNSTPQAAHLFALFSSFRKCTSNSSSLWNGSVNIGTDDEITGLVWRSFFPFLDFFCFTCFSWSSSVLRDTFYFLYILLQSSLNFTGSHNVFTKNLKLCSDICYYMYQHMYKITNPVFFISLYNVYIFRTIYTRFVAWQFGKYRFICCKNTCFTPDISQFMSFVNSNRHGTVCFR